MSSLHLSIRPDSVAVLTFDQPGSKANVLNAELWTELDAALDSLSGRIDLRGLVLASAKPGIFIAGADLKLLATAAGPNDPAVRGFIEQGLRVLEKLESLPFPTCAAIDGAALGGGLEVGLACDHRICGTHPKIQLGLPEVSLGLIPGWGGTQRLPRIVGLATALHLVTTGTALSRQEAEAIELTSPGATSEELLDTAARLVLSSSGTSLRLQRHDPVPAALRAAFSPPTELASAPREALRAMVEGAAMPLNQAIAVETEAFLRLTGSPESKRLIGEFFASRKK